MDRSDKRSAAMGKTNGEASTSNSINNRHVRDLFHEEAQGCPRPSHPWWKVQVFVWEPVLFGTWDGVFTTCMINIFGVVLFLRTGYLVGNTGVMLGVVLVSSVVLVALVTVMSGIGVSERCGVGSGGVYSMISTVLGGRVGGTVGLLYVFGQCVAGAMYITGFSESVAELLGLQSQWAVRGMSVAVLLGLLGINLAGVKWIVRLQLLLLAVLAVATLDFVVGTFTHLDPGHGFIGYTPELLSNNTMPDYSPGENFFTVFGVFFPAATGVMAGFNMSSDLQRPERSIPVGTLAAVFTSWFLYLVFVFLLGAICTREVLRDDFLIAEKVSLVGFLFLLGLYVSSLASCMGSLYGAPRILQCIAQERVIPALAFLGRRRGPDRTPVAAICLTTVVTMALIFIGQVNVLAPIVTINFLLTYSFVDYAYFSVAMACRRLPAEAQADALPPAKRLHLKPLLEVHHQNYGSGIRGPAAGKGTLLEFTQDMDRIFSLDANGNLKVESDEGTAPAPSSSSSSSAEKSRTARDGAKQTLLESFSLDQSANLSRIEEPPRGASEAENGCAEDAIAGPVPLPRAPQVEAAQKPSLGQQDLMACPQNPNTGAVFKLNPQGPDIGATPDSSYGIFCNPWVALIGAKGISQRPDGDDPITEFGRHGNKAVD
ncbi:solute carrier family 12 member 8 isoform X2 [Gadus macrocephalus]|uniref:solute carrier family 12 member 8 isoform X2 n=1 Tax=Gadus macrocephalus TaxID=80720 RepID=UPI0028CB252F|nr:solute carrier family 12 member 8 isoform X2 [Gadus macrocephalus]